MNTLILGNHPYLQTVALQRVKEGKQTYLFNPLNIEPLVWQPNYSINWHRIDKIIVISRNAVIHGLNLIINKLPATLNIFSIGPTSAAEIQTTELNITYPKQYNSESLLDLTALQNIENQKIVIFKGTDGRKFLQQTLQQRGAIVYTIDCYCRKPLNIDLTSELILWQNNQVTQLMVSSITSLQAFISQVPKNWQSWLKQLTVRVTSQRISDAAKKFGFDHVILDFNH